MAAGLSTVHPFCRQFWLWRIFYKINGLVDLSHCFAVTKVSAGVRSLGAVPDVRLPVTLPVLRLPVTLPVLSRLVHVLPALFSSRYNASCSRP